MKAHPLSLSKKHTHTHTEEDNAFVLPQPFRKKLICAGLLRDNLSPRDGKFVKAA